MERCKYMWLFRHWCRKGQSAGFIDSGRRAADSRPGINGRNLFPTGDWVVVSTKRL
jgi:hypothetical protein